MNNQGTFTLYGIDFPDGVDPLGIWHTPSIQVTSFSAANSGIESYANTSPVSLWQVQLPQDLDKADFILDTQLNHLNQQQHFLEEISVLLDELDPTLPSDTPYTIGGFDPQTVLLNSVNALRIQVITFDTGDTAIDYDTLYKRCEILYNRFRQVITRHGRIETRIGENIVGLTNIDWNGDFETIWEEHAAPLTMNVHVKSVRLASTSRLAVLRILSIVSTGALSLAIKASIPGGQFLLIPAVYKFIRDMLEEFKKIPIEN
jgi:hypothetical protein